MIEAKDYWMVALVVGVGTFLVRASFLLLPIRAGVGGRMELVLRFIPPAALTALVVPSVLIAEVGETLAIEKPVAAEPVAEVEEPVAEVEESAAEAEEPEAEAEEPEAEAEDSTS